ncbi:MAG: DEAD/DEAH box helicase [Candidatus Micrarchaeales archaeon]
MPSNPYEIFLNKFGSFTDIQNSAFESIKKGKNCIITAPTGSGKTEAAILPVFDRIVQSGNKRGIEVLYITPLRALNRDMMKRLRVLAEELGITISVRHGDTPTKERQLQAANPPQVLITTPETLQNLFLSPRLRSSLANVKTVIVDELHELYSNKRGAQLSIALERVAEISGEYQRIGISATLGNGEEAGKFLCGERKFVVVDAKAEKKIIVEIEMPQEPDKDHAEFREKFNLDLQTLARIERISELVRGSNSTLIFANTRQVVESLGSKLLYFNRISPFGSIGVHHSSLDRDERVSIEDAFKEGRVKSIIATSSLELGIDIGAIDLVIQYGSPRRVTRLIQRIGRGGHREKEASYGKLIVANHIEVLESLAITRLMHSGRIEEARMEENALDVLANQVCALSLEYRKLEIEKLYAIIKRAAPYSNLKKEELDRIIAFLNDEHLVRVKEDQVGIGSRSRPYFFSNISVIPDTVRFQVKDIANNKVISSLDEEFASNYLEEGAVFITKGMPWRVVSIEKETVHVETSADFEAAIPDWEGEDIPVSHDTAATMIGMFEQGIADEGVLNPKTKKGTMKFMELQKKHFVPECKKIVAEELESYSIVHIALGTLANAFLAKIVADVASLLSGNRVLVRSTPYAIIIDFAGKRKRPGIKRIFEILNNYNRSNFFKKDGLVTTTDIFRYKFVQVCKLFGIVEKKASMTKNNALRLITFYKDSPIMDETLRDLEKNYFDVNTTMKFLDGVKKGDISIDVFGGNASPLAEEILKASYYYKELLLPAIPDEMKIKEFSDRISRETVELLCTYCDLEFSKKVKIENDEKILCPRCKSPMVAVYDDEKANAVKRRIAGRQLNERLRMKYREAIGEAGLVDAYGSRALAALSVYGIGLATAAKVLKLLRKEHKQFIIDLIEAQKNFVRTKKYWK